MAHPNNETLSFTALMIIKLKFATFQFTLIIVTHSNINTLDNTKLYHYNSLSIY